MLIPLKRQYLRGATTGSLILPSGIQIMTLELPWRDNLRGVSCIPVGTYPVTIRWKRRVTQAEVADFSKRYEMDIKGWQPNLVLVLDPVGKRYFWQDSRQNFGWHFWVQNVPGRSGILIHQANYVRQLRGCIAPGMYHRHLDRDGIIDVAESVRAMNTMLAELPDQWRLKIT